MILEIDYLCMEGPDSNYGCPAWRRAATAFRRAITRLKQSGQAKRAPLPIRVRDKGRMIEACTSRRHSWQCLIFEGFLVNFARLIVNVGKGFRLAQGNRVGVAVSS